MLDPLLAAFMRYVGQLTGRFTMYITTPGAALPAYLRQRYDPHRVQVGGRPWLAVLLKAKDTPPPLVLRKQVEKLATIYDPALEGTSVVVAEHLSPYLRKRLVELGQAFVIPGRQLFWPALGSAETAQRPQRLSPQSVEQLSPVAQSLLIALLLRRLLPPITIGDAGEALGYTAASISQAVKALEGSSLVKSKARGRERMFELRDAPEATWRRAQSVLRSPVRRFIHVPESKLPSAAVRAGESALAEQSNLGAPEEPVYAMASREWSKGPDPTRFQRLMPVPVYSNYGDTHPGSRRRAALSIPCRYI